MALTHWTRVQFFISLTWSQTAEFLSTVSLVFIDKRRFDRVTFDRNHLMPQSFGCKSPLELNSSHPKVTPAPWAPHHSGPLLEHQVNPPSLLGCTYQISSQTQGSSRAWPKFGSFSSVHACHGIPIAAQSMSIDLTIDGFSECSEEEVEGGIPR